MKGDLESFYFSYESAIGGKILATDIENRACFKVPCSVKGLNLNYKL